MITAGNISKTYDGDTTASGSATLYSGTLYSTDHLSGGTFEFTSADAGSGNRTVTVSAVTVNDDNSGLNYDATYHNNTTSTINQKAGSLC